jgi:hypothetical protein
MKVWGKLAGLPFLLRQGDTTVALKSKEKW